MKYFITWLILLTLLGQGHARSRRAAPPQQGGCSSGSCQVVRSTAASVSESEEGTKASASSETVKTTCTTHDGLAEVNAKRARLGLPALVRDDDLQQAACRAAEYRAKTFIHGHANDFSFLRVQDVRVVAGCGALPPHWGWETCAYDRRNITHGGAAWVMGRDGNRYMHLFCR